LENYRSYLQKDANYVKFTLYIGEVMIQKESIVDVIDNSGAKKANCFMVYGAGNHAGIGDIIMVSIRSVTPNGKIKAGDKFKAIVVRTRSPLFRKSGDSIQFSDNAIVLIDEKKEPIGTRIIGIVPREVPQKIRSLASGVC
jgi:large subunit ribosomal protein L14